MKQIDSCVLEVMATNDDIDFNIIKERTGFVCISAGEKIAPATFDRATQCSSTESDALAPEPSATVRLTTGTIDKLDIL